jgi:RimJ/RimL family protein N-acetyltransferase
MMNEPFLATTPFQLNDASQFFELSKDPDIRKEFPNMRFENIDDAKQYLEHQISITESSRISFFKAIRIIFNEQEANYTEKNNILIGFISLHKTGSFDQMLAGGFEQTLSYAIKSAFRRKGLMTIALNMTLDAMKQDGYNVIAAIVKQNNSPSIRVLEKCGFVMVRDSQISFMYVKRITMDENEFKRVFGL